MAKAYASLASAAVQTSATAQNEATAVSDGSGVGTHDATAVSSVVQRLQEEVAALQEKLKVPTKELVMACPSAGTCRFDAWQLSKAQVCI